MPITPGARFGPYTVTSILGTGGMGQVYLARDARLDRNVALKVLPPDVVGDADRLQRFRREAMVLASLSHHNIAAIYGLEEGRTSESDAPVEAIVLELVEGPTLAERIAAGPVPLDEARGIGMQIAAALEAAHERGIVHRDLKPANVKIRPDGTVKVLDFGLAKAREGSSSGPVDVAASPTLTSPAQTHAGIILGTAAYMSPEQARGAPVDKRTDVWAFGCVLFEMLAGRHVFGGVGTVSDAIAAVLKSEPDWQALPADAPAHIRSLLKRCLEKDPRQRLRDIGDAGLLLAEGPDASDAAREPRATPPPGSPAMKWTAIGGWTLAALLAVALAIAIGGRFRAVTLPAPAVPLRLALPLASLVASPMTRSFAVSGDGSRLVFVGRDGKESSLYLQDLVSGDVRRLPETHHAWAPAFSPDDRAVGFMIGAAIKVLRLDGGLPRDIAQADSDRDHWAWSGPDHVVFTGASGLSRVSVNGGAPQAIAKLVDGESRFTDPFALPGGAYLVSVLAGANTDDALRVAVIGPEESQRLIVAERGGSPTFVPGGDSGSGHIIYADADRLVAVPFDAIRRVVKGSAVPMVENVAMRPNGDRAEYTVSKNGTLIFREGSLHELVWIDRGTGEIRPMSANLRRFALPRLSPDGRRLAMEMQDSPHQLWMLDIERDVLAPLTTETAGGHNFAWAPDGQSIVYTRGSKAPPQLGLIRTDGSGTVEQITVAGHGSVFVEDWSRNGTLVLLVGGPPNPAVMTARLEGTSPSRTVGTPVRIAGGSPGSFSPDGSWLAYCDCAVTRDRPPNIFIQHLESGARHQVSIDEGRQPLWAASGHELFFRAGNKMMAVPVTVEGATARLGRPQVLFEGEYLDWGQPNYDVTADGKQFVMVRTAGANARALSVRLNWLTELERLSPTQR